MGTLSDLVRGGLLGTTTDVVGTPVDLLTMMLRPFGYKTEKPVMGSEWLADRLGVQQTGSVPEQAARFATGLLSPGPAEFAQMGGLLGAIRAYHGSPHKFDKFSLEHMGKGEGAQAYGWGGYVAENPNVAREYTPIDINVNPARALADDELDAWSKAYATMLDMKGDKAKAIESLRKQEKIWQRKQSTPMDTDAAQWQIPRIRQAIGLISDDVAKVTHGNANFYELDLRWPDAAREAADPMGPQHFLDWDKPLSKQAQSIQDAINAAPNARRLTGNDVVRGQLTEPTGEAIANRFGRNAEGAKQMRDLGIPGIRYLDAGSRGAGQGTANYVVFDDAIIDLLKRNGIPIPKPADYRISHRPMQDTGGAARLHDLTKAFQDDVYGPNALQYYGSGDPREREILGLLGRLRGKPDAEVTIYRGVPKDAAKTINPGDWVTLSPSVAKDYGPNVVKMKVKASQVTSWPDSLLEFGYFP